FFRATSRRSPSTSITRSTRRNGYRCGRILRISAMRSSIQDYGLGTAGGGAFGAGAPAGAAALGAVILGSFWYAAFIIRMTSFVISEDLAAKIILVSCVDGSRTTARLLAFPYSSTIFWTSIATGWRCLA